MFDCAIADGAHSPNPFSRIVLAPMSLKYDAVETDEGGNRAATSTAADQEAKTDSTASSPAPQWSTSLLIVGFVVFLGGCSRGILFPVLWALCHELGGGVLSLGYVVAAFSLGRLVVTVPLGYFCDRYRHRRSLLIASTVLCCGALLWANVFLLGHLYWLLAAQLALGIGSGSLGVTRSFVAEQMPPSQRTETMGLMFALQYAGFTVSPIVGSVLSTMGKKIVYADTGAPSMIRSTEGTNATFTEFDDIIENTVVELSESKSFRYWEFALPAYALALACAACILLLTFCFQDIPDTREHKASPNHSKEAKERESAGPESVHNPMRQVGDSGGSGGSGEGVKTPESPDPEAWSEKTTAVVALMLLNVSTKGVIAVYETVGARIGMTAYGLSAVQMGMLITLSGTAGCLQLLFMRPIWTSRFADTELVGIGIAALVAAQLAMYSCGGDSLLEKQGGAGKPSLVQFVLSCFLMYGVGYPVGHTAVLGAFSKVQKSGPQAGMMGWFATAGSVGRIVLPLLGTLLESRQPSSSFSLNLLLLCASYAGLLLLRGSIHRCTTDRPAGAEVLSPLHTHHTAGTELSLLSVDEKPDEKGSSDCAGAVGTVGVVGADGGGRQWAAARSLVWPAVQLTMATALGCFALVSLLFCGCWTAAQCVHIVNPFTALA